MTTTGTFGTATRRTATITAIAWPTAFSTGTTYAVVVTDDGVTAQTRPGRGSLFRVADIGRTYAIEELNGFIVGAEVP